MFIGFYRLDNKENFYIYYKNKYGYEEWYKDTFSPTCEDIAVLDFTIKGNSYEEKKDCLRNIAIDYQNNFGGLSWSYGELSIIEDWFYKNAKRYGLVKEFKENCIC